MNDLSLINENVNLNIDLYGKRIDGYVEMLMKYETSLPTHVNVHSRRSKITNVYINDEVCKFKHLDYLSQVSPDHDVDISSFYVHLRSALDASNEGELSIEIPSKITSGDLVCNSQGLILSAEERKQYEIDEKDTYTKSPSKRKKFQDDNLNFTFISLRIHYEINDCSDVMVFHLPEEEESKVFPHMYTIGGEGSGSLSNLGGGPRLWIPCIDVPNTNCVWKIAYTINSDFVVVSTGELVDKVYKDDSKTEVTYIYQVNIPCSARDIGFAAGPFIIVEDDRDPSISSFCLPLRAYKSGIDAVNSNVLNIIRFYEEYLESPFPFDFIDEMDRDMRKERKGKEKHKFLGKKINMKQVFVSGLKATQKFTTFAGLAIIDQDLLLTEIYPEGEKEILKVQCLAIAAQWFNHLLAPLNTNDQWIFNGICGFMYNLYFREEEGEAAWRLRLVELSDTCADLERHHNTYPLSPSPTCVWISPSSHLHYSNICINKSPLIIHMLSERVNFSNFRQLLQGIVKDAMIECANEINPFESEKVHDISEGNAEKAVLEIKDLPRSLSSDNFIWRIFTSPDKKIEEIQESVFEFASQYIYGTGISVMTCGIWYTKTKLSGTVDLAIQQDVMPGGRIFIGTLNIMVHEEDIDTASSVHMYRALQGVKVHCKSKHGRKTTKREHSKEVLDEKKTVTESVLRWVRVDPRMQWHRKLIVRQPEINLVDQLANDDIIGKVDALKGLSEHPLLHESMSLSAVEAIYTCLDDRKEYVGLRVYAALSIADWQNKHCPINPFKTVMEGESWRGLDLLIKFFKEKWCDSRGLLKANDFSNNVDYELKMGLVKAIGKVKCKRGITPRDAVEFILMLLDDNDNTLNSFHDGTYVAVIIRSVGNLVLDPHFYEEGGENREDRVDIKLRIINQLKRYIDYESLLPSPTKRITEAVLEILPLFDVLKGGVGIINYSIFTSPLHSREVRVAAVKAIVKLYVHYSPKSSSNLSHSEGVWLESFSFLLSMLEGPCNIKTEIVNILLTTPSSPTLPSSYSSTPRVLHPSKSCDEIFDPLWGDSPAVLSVVQRFWTLLNCTSSCDAPLRRSLYTLFYAIFSFSTPPSLSFTTVKKTFGWSGKLKEWENLSGVIMREEGVPSISDYCVNVSNSHDIPISYPAALKFRRVDHNLWRVGDGPKIPLEYKEEIKGLKDKATIKIKRRESIAPAPPVKLIIKNNINITSSSN